MLCVWVLYNYICVYQRKSDLNTWKSQQVRPFNYPPLSICGIRLTIKVISVMMRVMDYVFFLLMRVTMMLL